MENGSRPPKHGGAGKLTSNTKGRKAPLPKEPDADDVKRLVLDYLSHSCYLSTARALSKPQVPPSHPTTSPSAASPPIAGPSSSSSAAAPPPPVARPTNGSVGQHDPNGEDVQMASEPGVLNGHATAFAASAPAAARGDADASDLMSVDGEGSGPASAAMSPASRNGYANGVSNGEGSAAGGGGANGEANGRPTVRFNPSLKVNSKTPAVLGGEFESINALYAGALSTEELDRIEQRGLVRAQILQGNIHSAMSLINTYFPTYFSPADAPADPAESYRSPLFVKPPAREQASPAGGAQDGDGPFAAPRTARPLAVMSSKPAHMQLNLLIQSFVETLRTVPVGPPPAPGNGRGSSPGASLTAASSPASSIHSASSAVSASSSAALAQAKSLYMSIDQLEEGSQKEWYQKEVYGAAGLLAYAPAESADPETRSYLDYSRREALADQINSALLVHTGRYSASTLEVLSRQTSFVWERLSFHNVDPVPPWTKEDGVEWERLGQYLSSHRQFDLGEFLDS